MQIRRRVHEILQVAAPGDRLSRAFDIFIVTLIATNVLGMVLETVRSAYLWSPALFRIFEWASVGVFTIEYVLRVWSCTVNPVYAGPVRGRLRFALTPLAMIDLLAVLPFYLPFVGLDLRFIRAIRLFRLFRVAKLGRYSQALRTFGRVLSEKKEELAVTLLLLSLLLLFASCLMYFAEHEAQPEAFSSIPAAMWWGVATLTTVGYGDVCPTTGAGKAIASLIAILGIGMFALPTGILGAGFVEEIQKRKKGPQTCPHCGKEIDDNG